MIGGDKAARDVAKSRAEQAVHYCESLDYKLPPEKYESWRDVEIVFGKQDF